MNVWKVGSRWGDNGGASLLRIFRRNGVVFIGKDTCLDRFSKEVQEGDYLAITDGITIVAVAKALEKPMLLQDMIAKNMVRFKATDIFRFNSGETLAAEQVLIQATDALAVRVKIVDLDKSQYKKYDRGSFEKVNSSNIRQFVIESYENNQTARFNIESYTCTLLKEKGTKSKKSILDSNTFYNIPIYQREYSWKEEQVIRFIRDIFEGFSDKEPIFIGTMQLSAPKFIANNEFEQDIIDGQQRLTTIFCLIKYISLAYPEIDFSAYNITNGWLETRVNNGNENALLQKLIDIKSLESLYIADSDKANKYIQNTIAIASFFEEMRSQGDSDDSEELNIADYLNYIFYSIYFVVIETYAGLSKTIRIFNTINTAGLDLNGDDLFKVNFFEYLKDVKGFDNSVFNEISEFYGNVKDINEEWHQKGHKNDLVSINEIRTIYKEYIISKFDLNRTLFSLSTDTFFERLFEQLLKVHDWSKDFGKNVDNVSLNLEDLDKILKVETLWNKHLHKSNSDELMISWHLFADTRYGKYRKIVYQVLLYNNNIEDAHRLLSILFRIAHCESIRYAKVVNSVITFFNDIYKEIYRQGISEAMGKALEKLEQSCSNIEIYIEQPIFKDGRCNRTWGNLICMLSAYLDEKKASTSVSDIMNKLFKTRFDFEHIHATANQNECVGIEPKLQNSIGNLMLLEYNLNRSIGKKPFAEKKEVYRKSKYAVAKQIAEETCWGEEQIRERLEKEKKAILDFYNLAK